MNYPCVSFLQKIRGVNPPEMHSVSREVRAPRIAHMLVRLCFDFLGYDFSVSKIFSNTYECIYIGDWSKSL